MNFIKYQHLKKIDTKYGERVSVLLDNRYIKDIQR